jgi:hypothetical protein
MTALSRRISVSRRAVIVARGDQRGARMQSVGTAGRTRSLSARPSLVFRPGRHRRNVGLSQHPHATTREDRVTVNKSPYGPGCCSETACAIRTVHPRSAITQRANHSSIRRYVSYSEVQPAASRHGAPRPLRECRAGTRCAARRGPDRLSHAAQGGPMPIAGTLRRPRHRRRCPPGRHR